MTEQNEELTENNINTKHRIRVRNSRRKYLSSNIIYRIEIASEEVYLLKTMESLNLLMQNYGYTPEKIAAFEQVCAESASLNHKKQDKYADKVNVHNVYIELLNKSKEEFKHITNVAKIALRNHAQKLSQLGLDQKKRRDVGGIFNAMQMFYDNILDDQEVIDLLAVYSFERVKIEQFQAVFLNARAAGSNYTREYSLAMESTRVRDQKMAILDDWMTEYYTMRKVAEGLGV